LSRSRWWRVAVIGVPFAVVVFSLLFPLVYALTTREERGAAPELPAVPQGQYLVLVADWGYHTSIVVEQPRDWALGPPGQEHASFIEYAWGDKRFYMESDFRPQSVFATIVLPTESVLYLNGRPRPISVDGARAAFVRSVNADTLRLLLIELERSFRRGADGNRLAPYPVASGFAGRFYPAHGRYLWTRDCNWWTVTRLHAAQLGSDARGVVFSGQVMSRLHGFHVTALR